MILLGTNDAANISAGSNADSSTRVARMADALAGEPTLWVEASTVRADGHWARPNIVAWNADLAWLLGQHPNIAFARWDAVASGQAWFVSDGIHPNAAGLAARARFVADNLRVYYPG